MVDPIQHTQRAEGEMPVLMLKKNEDRRLLAGHLWVYSNEVDSAKSPLSSFTAGDQVEVHSSRGRAVGMASINPKSLICARVYSYRRGESLATALIQKRIEAALALRQSLFDTDCYRLVHSEGDWLPGLIVDRYGDYLVVQINTVGMEAVQDDIIGVLVDLLEPAGIYLRNSSMAALEGLELNEKCVHGELPDSIRITENGLKFNICVQSGQKTGWFYDHRDNRQMLQKYCGGKKVLDAYSYLGGWGINALAGGAQSVTAIDSSAAAIDGARENAALNGYADSWNGIQGDVTEQLRVLRDRGEKFDVVVLDPPAFIQRAKDKRKGFEKYRSINALAVSLLNADGLLVSGSCSHHLTAAELQRAVLQAGRQGNYGVQVLARGHQSSDHPVHAAIPETEYLKAVYARLLR